MNRPVALSWSFVAVVSLAAGCGPGRPSQSAPPIAPVASTGPMAPPGPGDWAAWSHERKLAYMQGTVLGTERSIFGQFEPVRYATLNCHTCHGPGSSSGSFKMPNPELPRLAGGAEGFGELAAREPQVLKFMQQTVVPETARLLGVQAFDMESHTGFSCFHCHLRR